MSGFLKKPLKIIPLEKRLMLDASLAGLVTSLVIPENTANAVDTIIDNDGDVTVSGTTTDFSSDSLTITTNGGVEDQISINNEGAGAGQIGVSGTDITYEGIIIGSISSDGVNGANLQIDLNINASKAGIERLIENLTYRNTSDTPTVNRTINVSLGIYFSEDISLAIAPENDALTNPTNTGFTIASGTTTTITNTELNSLDVDNTNVELVYTITNAPLRGEIQIGGSSVSSFTQDDINNNLVSYVHDGTGSIFDRFNYTVTDGTATLVEDTFDIAVTQTNAAPTVTVNNPVTISLGFSGAIGGTADDFGTEVASYSPFSTFSSYQALTNFNDTQFRLVFTTPSIIPDAVPGQVLFESGGNGRGSGLYLNSNNELAVHSGAATVTPRLTTSESLKTNTQYAVVVELLTTTNEIKIHYEETGNHDWYYEGRTPEDILTGFTEDDLDGGDGAGVGELGGGVYGGFNGTVSGTTTFQGTIDSNLILTRPPASTPTANNDLVTFDSDTPPGQIIYTVTDVTDFGVLRLNGVALGLNDTFTQVDLNKGLITYDSVTDPGGPDIDAFGFSVTDGNTVVTDTYTININTVNTAPEIYDETVIYTEDFTGGTSGWSNNSTTTESTVVGEYWGQFNRNVDNTNDQDLFRTFTLSGTQDYVTLSFDMFEIDNWDNERFYIFVDDIRFDIGSFNANYQDLNNFSSGGVDIRITELSNDDGYTEVGNIDSRDQFFHYEVTIPVTASSIKLGFGTNLNSTNINDESLGIDNIRISELVAGGTGTRSVAVSELITNGEIATQIMAGDDDVGQSLTYSITGGTGVGVFNIDSTTGDITVIDDSVIDFETGPSSYTLDVQVRDNGPGLLTDTQTITINILDAYENTAPNITFTQFNLAENVANGASVGTLPFTDNEGDGIELWQIIDGNELGIFTINATTGEVTVADNTQINFENDNRYDLRIRGWDDNFLGLLTDQTMRINITNVDDAPSLNPEFIGENAGVPNVIYSASTGNFYRFVDSNANQATALANAEAALLNGVNGHLLTIESDAEKAFVNSISDQNLWLGISDVAQEGVWRYISGPNEGLQLWQGNTPENGGGPTNGFYTDWRGTGEPNNNGGNEDGAIFVRNDGRWQDVNAGSNYRYVIEWEGTDVVNNDTYYLNYDTPTDLNNGDVVGTVQGLDPEGDTLTYSIQGGTGAALFNLNPTTGEVTIADASLLNPLIDYTLTVRATEDNGVNQFAETTITIILNENLSIDTNAGHTATEGLTTIINPTTELAVSDNDGVATDIVFDIDTFPVNGQLELTTNPGVGIIEFTLDDLNNSRVQYVHDGTETLTDSFTFTVTDGGQTLPLETFNIAITPVNDAPVITVNTGATVIEGATIGITNTMLDSMDVDNTDAQLTYTASSYVRGQIEVSGSVQNTFTKDDVNNNRVVFRHDGNEGNASFSLSLSDGALTDTATFNLTTTPQNDSTVITTNTGFSVLEGGTFTITTTELNITDPDDSGTGITYSLSNIVGGQVQLTTNLGVPILSFTQADLVANRVIFVHDGGETNAIFDVEVADGLEHGAVVDNASVAVTRIPVNDVPEITRNLGTSVNEGGVTLINTIILDADDPDNTDAQITYTITNEVNGRVELLSNLGVQITSFTQAQLNANDIVFRHDGSTTTVASFDMQLSDGSLSSPVETFNLTVDNVNDPPVISVGSTATVNEGQSVAITTTELNSLDPDNLPITLTYTVTGTTNGDVQLSGVNTATFTQADLNAGLISFVHNGSETIVADFDVTLSDGSLTDTGTINLNVTPINDQTTLVVNDGDPNVIDFRDYMVSPYGVNQDGDGGDPTSFTVSPDGIELTITGNSWKSIPISYSLTSNTVLSFEFRSDNIGELHGIGFDNNSDHNGNFVYQVAGNDTWTGLNQSFNTYDAGDGWIRFEIPIGTDYTGAVDRMAFIADKDNGVANAESRYRNVSFYESTGILDLNEGNIFNITTTHITAIDVDDSGTGLDYTVSNLRNGVVQVSGTTATTFTQDDIVNNRVTFVHDGSETLTAGFDIVLADGLENSTTTDTDTFNLIINPVNDDVVVNTNTTLILDENATAIISSTNLNITDVDDSPNDVVITVTSTASDGIITRASAPTTPITSFKLAELNAGVIRYTQQGAENATASFDFSVSDPTGVASTGTFNFTINPINDDVTLTQNNTVNIAESGQTTITLADLNTIDADNTRAERVFTVTDTDSGWVKLTTQAGFPVTSFTQNDIANNRVVFRHDGSTATTSSFDFSVSDPTGNPTTGTFNLNVTPPVDEAPVVAISDGTPNTIDFSTTTISPYDAGGFGDGQGSTFTDFDVSNDGTVLTIYGNAWKKIPLPMTITADTVLTFDFRSTREGELQTIGFDNDDSIANGVFGYKLFGTDSSGLINNTYDTYNFGDGWTRFKIPVGADFTGTVTDLFFSADEDANADGLSQFRNVSVYEANPTITMAEGATIILSNTNLNVFDTDTPATSLTYNVTGKANGQIQLNGVDATSFTQDDIDNGRVTFIHDSSETTSASFNFTVTDGSSITASETFDITVTPVNDAPVVTNNGATVDEGGSFTFAGSSGSGITSIDVAGTPTNVLVDNVASESWILIGRGREGWEFDTNGQGNIADLFAGLGTNAAFDPVAYDDAFVNNLMAELGQDLTDTDIRIKRAANIAGTEYQEVRWTNASRANWSWDLDGNQFTVDQTSANSILGTGATDIGVDTQDTNPQTNNNYERIWTFNWPGKSNISGFSYGAPVFGVDGNDPNTFLWENTTENHATPYAEIYIKSNAFINSVYALAATDSDNAPSEIVYTITSETINGTVTRGGIDLGLNDTFTQADLDNGLISYDHDGSETTTDAFDFTVTDGDIILSSDTFDITINPINDVPTGINLTNDVVSEREVSGFKIANLNTSDVDLPGDTFTYAITSDPDGKFAIVGNELILNNTLSFATDEFHTVTIRTDDNNGGTFDQTFTINVEKVDNFVPLPSNPNFGDVGRGEEDNRDLSGQPNRAPLIQNFVSGNGINAFYGEGNLGQIIRENTTFDIQSFLNDVDANANDTNSFNFSNLESDGTDTPLSIDDAENNYTRMVDFLKSTQDFAGEDAVDSPDKKDNKNPDDVDLVVSSITSIDQEFDNIITYHEQRAEKLLEALK